MRSAFLFLATVILPLAFASAKVDFSKDREWLNLGHYENGKSLVHMMIGKENFFLATDGATNPASELNATIQQMFHGPTETQKKVQCHFPARRDFLLRHWSEIEPDTKPVIQACPELDAWLSKLGADSVSLIFATGYLNSAASSFGHTFLKIHDVRNNSGKELLDYGVNFAARTADTAGALYPIYGLFGYFPGDYAMVPYHQMIKEYMHLEGRDIWEYELTFTPAETRRMISHLLELEGTYFDYYFANQNCSWAILRALEAARPDLDLKTHQTIGVIPLDSLKVVARTPGLVKAIHYRPSLETTWNWKEKHLSKQDRQQLQKVFSEAQKEKLTAEDLSNTSTSVIDAGMDLFALKANGDHKKFDPPQFLMMQERAKRKIATGPEIDPQLLTSKTPPTESPDSMTFQWGLSELKNPLEKNSEAWAGVRVTFHDLLSEDQGVSPWSHLEFMSAKLYRNNHQQTQLGDYRLLEILSSQSSSWSAGPITWGVSFGGDRELLAPQRLHSHGLGKVGYSFDLIENLRWINLLELGTQQTLNGDWQGALAFNSMMVAKIGKHLRAKVGFEDLHFTADERRQETTAQMVFSPWLQWELRAGWREQDLWQSSEKSISHEASVSVEHHWLF